MRNQILKSFDSPESKIEQLKLFTPQLIDTAERIIKKRLNFIEKLNSPVEGTNIIEMLNQSFNDF